MAATVGGLCGQLNASAATSSPGEGIEVHTQRDSRVLWPSEEFTFDVTPTLPNLPSDALVRVRLLPNRGKDFLWETSFKPELNKPHSVAVSAPAHEGAYRIRISIEHDESLANRVTPLRFRGPLARREFGIAVVDPQVMLPRLTGQWTELTNIDLANPAWSQRLPQWVRRVGLPVADAKVLDVHGRRSVQSNAGSDLLELAPTEPSVEPTWIAVALAIDEPEAQHAVEIELPASRRQELVAAVVERNPDGKLTATAVAGGHVAEPLGLPEDQSSTLRLAFWPQSKSSSLVIVNKSFHEPLQIGSVRLLRRGVEAAPATPTDLSIRPERIVAEYFSAAAWQSAVGLGDDPRSWTVALQAAQRFAQRVHAGGYNAAVIPVAPDFPAAGESLIESKTPTTAEALEILARVFDREGLKLIPAVNLVQRDEQVAEGEQTAAEHADARPATTIFDRDSWQAARTEIETIARRFAGRRSFAGVALLLDGAGYGILPGLEDDCPEAVLSRFVREAGVTLPPPGDQRTAALRGPLRAHWVKWRNEQSTAFYRALLAGLPGSDQNLKAFLCWENALTQPAAAERMRSALAGRCSLLAATDEAGLDLRSLAEIDGAVLVRPQWIAPALDLPATAVSEYASTAMEIEDALAGTSRVAESIVFSPTALSLPSLPKKLGATSGDVLLRAGSSSLGSAMRAPLARALARRDCRAIFVGGPAGPEGLEPHLAEFLESVSELPVKVDDVRTEAVQPVVMRVVRSPDGTTAFLVNDSPWPTAAAVPVTATAATTWRRVGEAGGPATGELAAGNVEWTVNLPAYGAVAQTWNTRAVRVGGLALAPEPLAIEQLRRRLQDVEARMAGLDHPRTYPLLTNAGFELPAAETPVPGWSLQANERGAAMLDSQRLHSGAASLHLVSGDAAGTIATTDAFPLSPTGQLSATAQVRCLNFHPHTRLTATFEYQIAGKPAQRTATLCDKATGDQWTTCEITADDLPLDASPIRLKLHLAGPGEAWIDDVELFDVRLGSAQRIDLAKRFFAAKLALEEGKVVDCRRILDSYWPQYLVAYVPPIGVTPVEPTPDVRIAGHDEPTDGEQPNAESRRRKIAERVKELTPRWWR